MIVGKKRRLVQRALNRAWMAAGCKVNPRASVKRVHVSEALHLFIEGRVPNIPYARYFTRERLFPAMEAFRMPDLRDIQEGELHGRG